MFIIVDFYGWFFVILGSLLTWNDKEGIEKYRTKKKRFLRCFFKIKGDGWSQFTNFKFGIYVGKILENFNDCKLPVINKK